VKEEKELTLRIAEQISGETRDSVSDTYDALEVSRFHIVQDDSSHGFEIGGAEAVSYVTVVIAFFGSLFAQVAKDTAVKLLAEKFKAFLDHKKPLSEDDLKSVLKRIDRAVAAGQFPKNKGKRLSRDLQVLFARDQPA
jgi:ribosomal protein S20